LQMPPAVWFLIVVAGVGYLQLQARSLTLLRFLALALVPIMVMVPGLQASHSGIALRWSPYYAVYHDKARGAININSIAHQSILPFAAAGSPYSLVHLLQAHSGGAPFRDVLVIGAGSGNDLAHALRFGVERVDAVEIDPVIQAIGIADHPDRPY